MPTSTHTRSHKKRKKRKRRMHSKYTSTTHPASHYIINYSLASCRWSPLRRVSLRRISFCCYYYALLCFACAFIHYNDSSLRFLFAALRRVCAVLNYLRRLYVPSMDSAPLCVCFIYASAAVCSQFEYQPHIHTQF
jgi:hypothetical protein